MFHLARKMFCITVFYILLNAISLAVSDEDTAKNSSPQPTIIGDKMKEFGALVQVINELSQTDQNGNSDSLKSSNDSTHPVIDLNDYIMKQDDNGGSKSSLNEDKTKDTATVAADVTAEA
ncbi:unnamed protein product [Cylicocyclus nassatus]|uniref:Uncharacterized protein n=1 Tax=Cylicocyclus nassatus TaxID=53992 RepID=A0AA36MBR5_CYLNA|nr:unnamed protein product [Cylicocyclus nassatus]